MVVRVNISGDWVSGRVINSDGHGSPSWRAPVTLCVVRQEAVIAVRMPGVESAPHVPTQNAEFVAGAGPSAY